MASGRPLLLETSHASPKAPPSPPPPPWPSPSTSTSSPAGRHLAAHSS